MKHLQKILIYSFFLTAILSGCKKDFLNKGIPQDNLVTDNYYQNVTELRASTAFLYGKPWFDYNYPFMYFVGNIMSGQAVTYNYNTQAVAYGAFAIPADDGGLKYGWSSLYNVVGQSNTTINNIQKIAPISLGAARTAAIGEARFIRAAAYFNLVQLFGPVPIIEDNNKVVEHPLLNTNIVSDVYKFMIMDLKFAVANLPLKDDPGRVTKWSAEGMLAKVYLTKAGLTGSRNQMDIDSAKFYAADVVHNSGISLFPNYSDLFLSKNNNNSECLFGLQWGTTAATAYGNNDQRQTWTEGDSNIDGVGGGGWSGIRITADLAKSYSSVDLRRKATFMQDGDVYPELITAANPNGYSMNDTSGLYTKKFIVGGPLANAGANIRPQWGYSPTYMLRLADVYLIYAEAILGTSATTADPEALLYFNKVRTRAGLTTATSLDFVTILNERKKEMALENLFWFDLKRWHDYAPAAALSYIQSQDRSLASFSRTKGVYNDVLPLYKNVTPTTFTLPYPAVDVTTDPKLKDPPVPYY